jgi:hypothetical protein
MAGVGGWPHRRWKVVAPMTSPSLVPAPAVLVASTITWAGTPCATDWVQPGDRPVELAGGRRRRWLWARPRCWWVSCAFARKGRGDRSGCCLVGHGPDSAMGHGDVWCVHSRREGVRGEEEGKGRRHFQSPPAAGSELEIISSRQLPHPVGPLVSLVVVGISGSIGQARGLHR